MGAINGAIIAGNKPAERVKKLRDFWERITPASAFLGQTSTFAPFIGEWGEMARNFINQISAGEAALKGVPGFFTPRMPPPWFYPAGSSSALSFYTTERLAETLEEFIDFDILNAGDIRYTTSAVNISSGNYTLFDGAEQRINTAHVMASAALPPGLPAVEIDGEHYWDAGLISNTPLQWIMNEEYKKDTLVFQVDLWSARGEFPKDVIEVMTREKEIQYSSRTRSMTDRFKRVHQLRHAFADLYEEMPQELKETKEAKLLHAASSKEVYNIVHLIYRARAYEGYSKDYEFSRLSMEEHWKAGFNDTMRTLRHKEILHMPTNNNGIMTYDLTGASE
jgi:NTE family protein